MILVHWNNRDFTFNHQTINGILFVKRILDETNVKTIEGAFDWFAGVAADLSNDAIGEWLGMAPRTIKGWRHTLGIPSWGSVMMQHANTKIVPPVVEPSPVTWKGNQHAVSRSEGELRKEQAWEMGIPMTDDPCHPLRCKYHDACKKALKVSTHAVPPCESLLKSEIESKMQYQRITI